MTTTQATNRIEKDWEELKTDELLLKARSTGYFADIIEYAQHLQDRDGYLWVVALSKALAYECPWLTQ